ncbi:MAG: hypothetical protein NW206_17325 [Hyphomonadaceae bacterium]|nr:hypothetical protein [Hyphomonadaceae bacterium]
MRPRSPAHKRHTSAHKKGAQEAHKTQRDATHTAVKGEVSGKTPKRHRSIPDINGSVRLEEKLHMLLRDPDPDLTVYVYRLVNGRTLKPALLRAYPFRGLLTHIQESYGGGAFAIFIRRGPRMELTGSVRIAAARTI